MVTASDKITLLLCIIKIDSVYKLIERSEEIIYGAKLAIAWYVVAKSQLPVLLSSSHVNCQKRSSFIQI